MEQTEFSVPMTERLKAIPGFFGIQLNEKPEYRLMWKDEFRHCHIEIREYQPLVMVTTPMAGMHEQAREQAFLRLAAYIFRHHIPMTSPVFQTQRLHEGQNFAMSFVLPSKITAKMAPQPEDANLHIEVTPVQTWAVLQYSGRYDLNEMNLKKQILQDWLKVRGQREDRPALRIAQYDGPMTIPFLRRNEVQILLWSKQLNS